MPGARNRGNVLRGGGGRRLTLPEGRRGQRRRARWRWRRLRVHSPGHGGIRRLGDGLGRSSRGRARVGLGKEILERVLERLLVLQRHHERGECAAPRTSSAARASSLLNPIPVSCSTSDANLLSRSEAMVARRSARPALSAAETDLVPKNRPLAQLPERRGNGAHGRTQARPWS